MSTAQHDNLMRQLKNAMRAPAPTRFAPLVGMTIGGAGGAVYWLAAQLWPTSIALVLAMLAGSLLTTDLASAAKVGRREILSQLFYLLLKYNTLMALSAAKLPFAAPANLALPLVMISSYAASRALFVSLMATLPQKAGARVSNVDLGLALSLGLAPAVLLGIPGLVGLAVAIVSCIGIGSYLKMRQGMYRGEVLAGPMLAEVCFYLGAQASWSYVN